MELEVIKVSRKGRKAYKDSEGTIYLQCTKCEKPHEYSNFYNNKNKFMGKDVFCKKCSSEDAKAWREKNKGYKKEYNHRWYIENYPRTKERMKANSKRWRKENRDKHNLRELRRRARKKALPDTLTSEQILLLGNSCYLTGVSNDIHLDHVIPLAIGHGGTIYENMIPLSAEVNMSKQANNIFEWAEQNHERLGFTMERFNEVMSEVAERNNMTLEEYREYVYWCFENKRVLATV
jgi:hypothetical protein